FRIWGRSWNGSLVFGLVNLLDDFLLNHRVFEELAGFLSQLVVGDSFERLCLDGGLGKGSCGSLFGSGLGLRAATTSSRRLSRRSAAARLGFIGIGFSGLFAAGTASRLGRRFFFRGGLAFLGRFELGFDDRVPLLERFGFAGQSGGKLIGDSLKVEIGNRADL